MIIVRMTLQVKYMVGDFYMLVLIALVLMLQVAHLLISNQLHKMVVRY